jgi:hypothetical protein
MTRSSFQVPKPGRVYEQWKTNRSGKRVRYLVVEIRTAPGALERTGFSLSQWTPEVAERKAIAWLKPRQAQQRKNYAAVRRAWDKRNVTIVEGRRARVNDA